MKPSLKTYLFLVSGLGALVSLAWIFANAQAAPAPTQPKTAGQAFKNIVVLKNVPADQLVPGMQFIAASLGVECDFCHVEGAFEKDDKQTKVTARKMIQMMMVINQENFDDHREVTCYTCHRGHEKPVSIPVIAAENAQPSQLAGEEASPPASLPAADQVIDKYVQAIGGAAALQKSASRVEKGTLTGFGGKQFPIEIYAKAPGKRVSIMHLPDGESITAFDGTSGWLGAPGRPAREMHGGEVEAARLDADFYFPIRIKQIFTELKTDRTEKVGDHVAYVVAGTRQGQPPVYLYFDQQSALLVRLLRFTDSPLGLNPTQIDYSDYREIEGVKIPYRWTLARTSGAFTIQVQDAQQNVPVDDAKFAKPPEAAPKQ
jgi:hypothetical protein